MLKPNPTTVASPRFTVPQDQLHILLVSDDAGFSTAISSCLRHAGYGVTLCNQVDNGLDVARSTFPNLILIDGDSDALALAVIRQIRANTSDSPTLISLLTNKLADSLVASGFDAGADDVSSKAQSPQALLSRIRAMLRRANVRSGREENQVASCHELVVDRRAHRVAVAGEPVDLTPIEFSLLDMFVRNPGAVLNRNQLLSASHGADCVVTKRTVDVHVRSLRIKLGEHANAIETVRGLGYRLNDEVQEASTASSLPKQTLSSSSSYMQSHHSS